jgi:DNA mismatch repair ATPase MutS
VRRWLIPGPPNFTLQLHPRDEAGARAFAELQNRGLALISDALWQSAQHVLDFFKALRAELAFYIGCVNLHERLCLIGEVSTFPECSETPRRFACRNLRDVCLALTMGRNVIGNDVDGNDKALIVITGANRGGKTTSA